MNFQKDTLYLVPLGGCGEFGGNLMLYGWNGKWLMLDCGIGFNRHHLLPQLNLQILMPDPAFIASQKENLLGCVITHAHEDHVGAVPYLWDLLQCPVYMSPFAARIMAERAFELGKDIHPHLVYPDDVIELGPFSCRMLSVTHSVPEAMMIAIKTPVGTIIHTGDWKLDPDPLVGELTNEAALKQFGEQGVLAVVGDSTNAQVAGTSGSESTVRDGLTKLFGTLDQRIVVSMMSRNLCRIQAIAEAAYANDREVSLVGRSLWTAESIGRDLGYFADLPAFISPKKIMRLPRDRMVLIATGTQGESNAALTRMADNEHPFIRIERNDTVVYSSRVIPGNEAAVNEVHQKFTNRGVRIITREYPDIYVSGHPCAEEMKRVYGWLKPRYVIPVHGEPEQQQAHAKLAEGLGHQTLVPQNGNVMQVGAETLAVVGQVPTGHLALRNIEGEDSARYTLERFN